MIERHVHGLFVLGSTGMGPVMTTEQRVATAEFVVKQVRQRVPVIMHVGTADVQTTVKLAKARRRFRGGCSRLRSTILLYGPYAMGNHSPL